MTGKEMRAVRLGLGLSQQEFADELGQHRLTIVQYERGFRSKDKMPSEIPRVVELACAAIWAGLNGVEKIDDDTGECLEIKELPVNAVPDPHKSRAIRALERRKVKLLEVRMFFPWSIFRKFWPRISAWADDNEIKVLLHTVLYRDEVGEGVAVLMFPDRTIAAAFRLVWTGGRDEIERPTTERP